MKLPEISLDYLGPIELGPCEWVSVKLPDGRTVTVFADKIYVATEKDVLNHRDGTRIWNATGSRFFPYGRTLIVGAGTVKHK